MENIPYQCRKKHPTDLCHAQAKTHKIKITSKLRAKGVERQTDRRQGKRSRRSSEGSAHPEDLISPAGCPPPP